MITEDLHKTYLRQSIDSFENKTSFLGSTPDIIDTEQPVGENIEQSLSNVPSAFKIIKGLQKEPYKNLLEQNAILEKASPESILKKFWQSKVMKYLLPELTQTPAQKVVYYHDALVSAGVESKLALETATKEVFAKGPGLFTKGERLIELEKLVKDGKLSYKEAIKEIGTMKGRLTKEQADAFAKAKDKKSMGKITDMIIFFPIGSLQNMGIKNVSNVVTGKTVDKLIDLSFKNVGKSFLPTKVPTKLAQKEIEGKALGVWGTYIAPYWHSLRKIGAKPIYDRLDDAGTAYLRDKETFQVLYKTLFQGMGRNSKSDKVIGQLLRNYTSKAELLGASNKINIGTKIYDVTGREKYLASSARKIYDSLFYKINESLVSVGEKPVAYRAKYLTKIFDDIAKILIKRKELPSGLIEALKYTTPKKIFFPYGLKRVSALEPATPSVMTSLERYTNSALKTIDYTSALNEVKPLINQLPVVSKKFVKDWIQNTILKRPAASDKAINITVSKIADTLNKIPLVGKIIKPVGYTEGATKFLNNMRNLTYSGTMGLNIPLAIRNLTQGFLTFGELGTKYTTAGYQGLFTKKGKDLLKQCGLLKGRMPILELMPEGYWTKNTQRLMYFYRKADYVNVGAAFIGGYERAIAKGLPKTAALREANDIAKLLQFSYRATDLPIFMSSGGIAGKYLGQFKTWPISYAEVLMKWAGEGKTGAWKISRYLASSGGFVYGMKKMWGIDYSRILPHKVWKLWGFGNTISPGSPFFSWWEDAGKLMDGLSTGNTQSTSQAVNSLINYDLPTILPAGVMLRKAIKVLKGTGELKSLFFPVEYKTPEQIEEEKLEKKRESIVLP